MHCPWLGPPSNSEVQCFPKLFKPRLVNRLTINHEINLEISGDTLESITPTLAFPIPYHLYDQKLYDEHRPGIIHCTANTCSSRGIATLPKTQTTSTPSQLDLVHDTCTVLPCYHATESSWRPLLVNRREYCTRYWGQARFPVEHKICSGRKLLVSLVSFLYLCHTYTEI